MRRTGLAVLAIGSVLAGCGDSVSSGSGGDGTGGGTTSATTGVGAGPSGQWELLLEGAWSLPPGSEDYVCVIATIPEDTYVGAFRPIAPLGTHHTVLTRTDSGVDGVYPCDVGTNGENMIYGSGVGTEPGYFPPGVAVKLEAGDKVLLNLHLFNASPNPLEGTSGIEIQRIDSSAVEHEAESVLAGTLSLLIPPNSTVTETGYCTLPSAVTLFAVAPHMHQIGEHMKVTATNAGGDHVVLDADYSFDEQRHYPVDPQIPLESGDQIRVDCRYANPTNETVTWGDSSNAEMCFAGLYIYPASAGIGLICSD